MSIRYKIYKSRFKDKQGQENNYIMYKSVETMDMDKVEQMISDACSVNESDIAAVLEAFKFVISMGFAMGENVPLYDLGVFKPKLMAEFDKNGHVIANSEKIKTIQFIPSASFLKDVRKKAKFKHLRSDAIVMSDFEERSQKYLNSLSAGEVFTRYDYQYSIKMNYQTAVNDLNKLTKMKKINSYKMERNIFYCLAGEGDEYKPDFASLAKKR